MIIIIIIIIIITIISTTAIIIIIIINHHHHQSSPLSSLSLSSIIFPFFIALQMAYPRGHWIACQLFKKRWMSRLYSIHSVTPTFTGQNFSLSHWACFSLTGPSWTVCHMLPTSAPILNLCEINHYQLRGSISLCPLTTTRRSPTMG